MIATSALAALASALVFTGLVLIRDRPRGALIAQGGSLAAGFLILAVLVAGERVASEQISRLSALGIALLAATLAGMFYHLYLGRFGDVWRARFTFTLVYLAMAAVLGVLYLSLLQK